MMLPAELAFEILAKDAGAGEASPPAREGGRPSAETIERLRRYFTGRGVRCHPTAFGLVGYASLEVFEKLFGVQLRPGAKGVSQPPFEMDGEPTPPAEVAGLIELVTIPGAPELF